MIAAALIRTPARSRAGVAAQAGSAARAAATAASACSAPAIAVAADDPRAVARVERVEHGGRRCSTSSAVDQQRDSARPSLLPDVLDGPGHRLAILGPAKSVTGSLRNGGSSAASRAASGLRPSGPASTWLRSPRGCAAGRRSGACSVEAGLQERLVRRVLQQPAHQVGHARQHRAVGRVDPDAVAAGDQGSWITSPMPWSVWSS